MSRPFLLLRQPPATLSFDGSDMENLTEERAERSTRGDDGTLGAERSPVPMEIAADTGFRMVTRFGMRLSLSSTCSIASGMP